MQDNLLQTEGIVLKKAPFKNYDSLLTLFTPQMGLFKLYVKGSKKKLTHYQPLTTPYTIGEFIYVMGKGDLAFYYDGSIIKQNLELRNSFNHLQAAEKMCQALLQSQWPGKPSSSLYYLFRLYLEKLGNLPQVDALYASFLLKILCHEGIFSDQRKCCECEKWLEMPLRFQGDCFCNAHAPFGAIEFLKDEEALLEQLAFSRALQPIIDSSITPAILKKIESLFQQSFVL